MPLSKRKIVSVSSLKRHLAPLRREGRVIAFTTGCFDLLHYGHVTYLEKAKAKDRILVVGLNSDASVRRLKGTSRPIVHQDGRSTVVAALGCVDFVVVFDEDTPYELIQAVKPDILIKGADWKGKDIVGSDVVVSSGGEVELIHYEDGFSTTNIIDRIRRLES